LENAGTEFAPEIKLWVRSTPDDMWWSINVIEMREDKCGISPYDYVISVNIHRRHLSVAEKRELVAKLLKAAPAKSNRAIAEAVKVDHKTVAAVRTEKVATGEIPQLTKTVGKDGKTRKARTKPDAWEYKTGTATACYTAGDGAQIYKVEEIARKRKTPRYHAWVLTEVGHVTFDKVFHSMEAAKRFCEHHAREWQRNNRRSREAADDEAAAQEFHHRAGTAVSAQCYRAL
jgi:hypothetical protein